MGRKGRIPRACKRGRLYPRTRLSTAHGDQPVTKSAIPLGRRTQHADPDCRQSSRRRLAVKRASVKIRLLAPQRAHPTRLLLMAALLIDAVFCGPAFAQQLDYVPEVNDLSTLPIGPTSPLG